MDIELIFIFIVVLLVLLLVSGLIFFILKDRKSKKEYKVLSKDYDQLKHDYNLLYKEYINLKSQIIKLGKENNELSRDKAELERLFYQPTNQPTAKNTVTLNSGNRQNEVRTTKETPPVVQVMYASFPRSAGSSIYFTDLTANIVEDSFFELKLSKDNNKATFKPLDFMKIRNYDPAMVAMITEGVKPNVASTVLGIEPGTAHIEGKDWIIDNPAKIKLA